MKDSRHDNNDLSYGIEKRYALQSWRWLENYCLVNGCSDLVKRYTVDVNWEADRIYGNVIDALDELGKTTEWLTYMLMSEGI